MMVVVCVHVLANIDRCLPIDARSVKHSIYHSVLPIARWLGKLFVLLLSLLGHLNWKRCLRV